MNKQQQIGRPVVHKWTSFCAEMLERLPAGKYPLRPRVSITPSVPDMGLCPQEDQDLFAQVDQMERDLLDTVIQQKVRELNRDNNLRMLVCKVGTIASTGPRQQNLVIMNSMDNKPISPNLEAVVKDLGELLQMGYAQILLPYPAQASPTPESPTTGIPVGHWSSTPADINQCLHDHNYWNHFKNLTPQSTLTNIH